VSSTNRLNVEEIYQRVHDAVLGQYDLTQIADWARKHIKLNGRNLSFKGREYQERILQSSATEIVVPKCSQVGISELMLINSLALCTIVDGFNIIYTLPTATFAQRVMKTRVDPIIANCKELSNRLAKTLDNASVKGFGNSHLYLSGTNNNNAVISTPADAIFADELDFSDQTMVEKLQSRLTASSYRWWRFASTPTVANYGIDKRFKSTRRHYNFCKCCHCNYFFIPSYLDHVRIPGYEGSLLNITKPMLNTINWQAATLFCPKCAKPADLSIGNRVWVCENPEDTGFEGEGFQIYPTDAPEVIKMSDLILWSTKFDSKVQFQNFHLGITAEDEDSGLNASDVEVMKEVGTESLRGPRVFGIDLGTTCHIVVAVTNGVDKLTVTELHRVAYSEFENTLRKLIRIHRPSTILSDTQPYVETIYRLQGTIKNLYGALYSSKKTMEMFHLRETDEDLAQALLRVRQVDINRNFAFNTLMDSIRKGYIGVAPNIQDSSLFAEHLMDMKRVPSGGRRAFSDEPSNTEVESYLWVKTSGIDHYHHALLYAYVAMHLVKHVPQRNHVTPLYFNTVKIKTQNL
jgi:hypothetical protein